MKSLLEDRSGLVLAEVLVAITILAIGSLVLAGLINNGLRTMTFSENYLIAKNFATEGIESIKNIRNTNWLLQADNPDCWLELSPDESAGCADKVMAGEYYIPEVVDGRWQLTNIPGELNLEDEISDESFRLGTNSIFYRGIKAIDIEDYAKFEVIVQWMEGKKFRSIKWPFILHNNE